MKQLSNLGRIVFNRWTISAIAISIQIWTPHIPADQATHSSPSQLLQTPLAHTKITLPLLHAQEPNPIPPANPAQTDTPSPTQKPQPPDQSSEQSTEQSSQQSTEQSSEQSTEQPTEQSSEQSTEQSSEPSVEESDDEFVEQPTEETTEQSIEKEAESSSTATTKNDEIILKPVYYVFEIELGVNAFGYNVNRTTERYNLDNISDTVALSYNLKTGVVFLDHWKSILVFGYSKRPNFEYPVNYIRPYQSLLEAHRYYRFGFEQQYLIWSYENRFNLGVGLENSWLRRSVSVTERTNVGLAGESISRPRMLAWDEYLLSPKIKFLYRISPNSALHFTFSYHILFPSIEYYPQFLFGIDLSFFLRKPKEPLTKPSIDNIIPDAKQIPSIVPEP